MRPQDKLTVVTKDPIYHFVPSNPWVAVGWRSRQSVEVDLAPTLAKRGIAFKPVPVAKVFPNENRLELADGSAIRYDYLVIATGPELAFDEIEGPRPRRQHLVDLPHRPCAEGGRQLRGILQESRADRHRRGAGRLVLRPRLRIHVHSRDRTAPPPHPRPRADDLRHRRTLYRPPRPRRRRRHQGSARKRNA